MFVNVHENVASKLCFCRRRCYKTQYCPSVMCVIYLLFAYFRPERYEFAQLLLHNVSLFSFCIGFMHGPVVPQQARPMVLGVALTTRFWMYQKGKTNLDFTEARDSEWQWHQLGHMQVCTSLQTDKHASTHHSVFYRPDALPAVQPTASKHWRHKKKKNSQSKSCQLLHNCRNKLCNKSTTKRSDGVRALRSTDAK